MKKIYSFDYNIYSGNLYNDFFKFSIIRKFKLIIYIFIHLFNSLKSTITKTKVNKWDFLKKIDVNEVSKMFWIKNYKKINTNLLDKNSIIVTNYPKIIFKPLEKIKIRFSDENIETAIIDNIKNSKDEIYYYKYEKKFIKHNLFIKIGKKYYKYKTKSFFIKIISKIVFLILILLSLTTFISSFSLYFAKGTYDSSIFSYYFESKKLILLNSFPIFILLSLLYFIFNGLALSFIFTSSIVLLLTMINYFKIFLRNDVFIFSDFTLFNEASEMLNTYTLTFPIQFFIFVILIMILCIIIKIISFKIFYPLVRIIMIIFLLLVTFVSYEFVYIKPGIYENTSMTHNYILNMNSNTQKFISKGFIYPFIYSTTNKGIEKPSNYSIEKAQNELKKYTTENISNDKKVHVISIMLESYSDFSNLGDLEFTTDIYKYLHELEKKSYSGNLITNTFGGGTVNTERRFLTGYTYYQFSPRKNVNSYVDYFNNQGYITTGSHPGYSWFYNRVNVNRYLGFQSYKFFNDTNKVDLSETKYNWHGMASDLFVIDDIIKDYKVSLENNKYIFNFSVTYQNHGPQDTKYNGDTYIKKTDNFTDVGYNVLNYYFDGIYKTNKAIKELIEFFEKENNPVIIILFGDHKPSLGDNKDGFTDANININLDSESGFRNLYTTPYIIWANNNAKERLNNDFIGDGEDLSANYLMGKFFELASYKGTDYIQYTNELMKKINVIHHEAYEEEGTFVINLSKEAQKRLNDFENVQYYYENNYQN